LKFAGPIKRTRVLTSCEDINSRPARPPAPQEGIGYTYSDQCLRPQRRSALAVTLTYSHSRVTAASAVARTPHPHPPPGAHCQLTLPLSLS